MSIEKYLALYDFLRDLKDKEEKIAFLQKAIDALEFVTGNHVGMRPSKTVAGHEPDKTNLFLQSLATSAAKRMNSRDAVKKVLAGEKPTSSSTSKVAKAPDKKDSTKSNGTKNEAKATKETTHRSKSIEKNNNTRSRSRSKADSDRKTSPRNKEEGENVDKKTRKHDETKKDQSENGETVQVDEKENELKREKPTTATLRRGDRPVDTTEAAVNDSQLSVTPQVLTNGDVSTTDNEEHLHNEHNSSVELVNGDNALGAENNHSEKPSLDLNAQNDDTVAMNHDQPISVAKPSHGSDGIDEIPPRPATRMMQHGDVRSARPRSSRPAAPRLVRNKLHDQDVSLGGRPPTSLPVAKVIVDSEVDKAQEEDETDFVVSTETNPLDILVDPPTGGGGIGVPPVSTSTSGQQGSLVRQLLETKKELNVAAAQIVAATDPSVMVAESEATALIQQVTSRALPIGRLLDRVFEHLRSMLDEKAMWAKERDDNLKALQAHQLDNEAALEEMKAHLEQLENTIVRESERLSAIKYRILKERERLQRFLASYG